MNGMRDSTSITGLRRAPGWPGLRLGAIAALLAAAGAASAVAEEPACEPVLEETWIRAAPPGATTLAGYGVLRNRCATAVAVTGVESLDFAMPMIHRTEVIDGVGRMRDAGELQVPAQGELRFEPNGLHLMLMRPERPLAEGDVARVRLVLEDGRRVFAAFPVRRDAPSAGNSD
jgi:copper(I)-binding protein